MHQLEIGHLAVPKSKRIVFLGDSITENGTYIRDLDAFFLKHLPQHRIELINLGVSSETAAGTSERAHPFPRPCVHERLERALRETRPDWVFLCYGMNDGIYHPFSEDLFTAYCAGVRRAVESVRTAGYRVILMTPPPFDVKSANVEPQPEGMADYSFERPYEDYNAVLGRYAAWIREYGEEQGITTADLREPLMSMIRLKRGENPAYKYGDGIHPDEDGHFVIARTILSRVFHVELERVPEWAESDERNYIRLAGERRNILNAAWREHVGHGNPNKFETLPLQEALKLAETLLPEIRREAEKEGGAESAVQSEWKGHQRTDFHHDGRECIVVAPKSAAPGRPWVWRSEFFDVFADADMALLQQGWHLAYCRLSDLYGCPYAAERMEVFRSYLTSTYGLNPKPVLFGFSRGGLYALRYAATYPQHVAALYLDAPVVDIRSWPGGKGTGLGSPEEWQDCLKVYGITGEENVRAGEVTAKLLDALAAPAAAKVPILLVSGDSDRYVPFTENGALLERRYPALGGKVRTILKPGGDHHPHSLSDVRPIIDFCHHAYLTKWETAKTAGEFQ